VINLPTLFILGAGASMPYGYPSGKQLRTEIVSNFMPYFEKTFETDSSISLRQINDYRRKGITLANVFNKSSVESIDKFLSLNPSFADIGKLAITFFMLQHEKSSLFQEETIISGQDWYTHLFNIMISSLKNPSDLKRFKENRVAFITFNYDRSLEYILYSSLNHAFWDNRVSIKAEETTLQSWQQEFFPFPIVHVYGQIGNSGWLCGKNYREDCNFQQIIEISKGIRVIGERSNNSKEEISKLFLEYKRIYFLGFGYTDENLEAIGIPGNITENHTLYGTALGMKANEIERVKQKLKANPNAKYINANIENKNSYELLRERPLC
jgi:hypothetical protein